MLQSTGKLPFGGNCQHPGSLQCSAGLACELCTRLAVQPVGVHCMLAHSWSIKPLVESTWPTAALRQTCQTQQAACDTQGRCADTCSNVCCASLCVPCCVVLTFREQRSDGGPANPHCRGHALFLTAHQHRHWVCIAAAAARAGGRGCGGPVDCNRLADQGIPVFKATAAAEQLSCLSRDPGLCCVQLLLRPGGELLGYMPCLVTSACGQGVGCIGVVRICVLGFCTAFCAPSACTAVRSG